MILKTLSLLFLTGALPVSLTSPCIPHIAPSNHLDYMASRICNTYSTQGTMSESKQPNIHIYYALLLSTLESSVGKPGIFYIQENKESTEVNICQTSSIQIFSMKTYSHTSL
jgi:hypothetical protein